MILAFSACGHQAPGNKLAALPRGHKDVVVILVDTLRADRLGVYGYERPTSPNIDRFAKEAVVFNNCISQSTWTKPSVASFLTGLLPAEHGVHRTRTPLDERIITVAERLRSLGYQTAGFVANGLVSRPKHQMGQGFQVFEGTFAEDPSVPYPRAEAVVDRSIEWLEGLGGPKELNTSVDEPIFLYVHLFDPHVPYNPPEPFRGEFDRGIAGAFDGFYPVSKPGTSAEDLAPADWEHWRDLYDAEIAYGDQQIGRLLDALRQEERFEDALVVFLSDHGEEFFEHGNWGHNPNMYQEVVHVPLIVKAPSSFGIEGGQRVDTLAMQIDFVPTILDLNGVEQEAALTGVSWFSRILFASEPLPARAYSEVNHHGNIRRGIFEGDWKRLRADAPIREDLLFDLARDPHELRNEFASKNTPLERLERLMEAFEERGPVSKTLAVRLSNVDGVEHRLTLRIASAPPPIGIDPYETEEKSDSPQSIRDGPLSISQESWPAGELETVSISLCLPPGDTDRLNVDLATGCESVWIYLEENKKPFPSTQLLIGSTLAPATAIPLEIQLDDPLLLRDEPGLNENREAAESSTGEVAGFIWLVPGAGLRPLEFSAEEQAHLGDLGYGSGD